MPLHFGLPRTASHIDALNDGGAIAAGGECEAMGRRCGVRGTPGWLIADQLISGLLPTQDFERSAESELQSTQ